MELSLVFLHMLLAVKNEPRNAFVVVDDGTTQPRILRLVARYLIVNTRFIIIL